MTFHTPMPVAYSYARFSDPKQKRGDSIRRQLQMARDYATEFGLRLDETTTITDPGISAFRGANLELGEMGVFIEAAKRGRIPAGSYLLLEHFDRLSRQTPVEVLPTFIALLKAGVIVVTLQDRRVHDLASYSENSMLLMGSLMIMEQAHKESLNKSHRGKQNWKAKRSRQAQTGEILTRKGPSWLRWTPTNSGRGQWEIIEERAAVVRRIFDELISGIGREAIARRLNAEGVPSFGRGGKGGGGQWHGGTVQVFTTNSAVIGHFQSHSLVKERTVGPDGRTRIKEIRIPEGDLISDYYPPIISHEVWNKAQVVSRKRSVMPGNMGGAKGYRFSNLLSGLTYCMACRNVMNYRDMGTRSKVVLRCRGYRNGLCDNAHGYDYHRLETGLLDWMEELTVEDTRSGEEDALNLRMAELTTQQATETARIRRLIDVAMDTDDNEHVRARIKDLQAQANRIKAELQETSLKLAAISTTPSPHERKEQVKALRHKMAGIEAAAEAAREAGEIGKSAAKFRELYRIRSTLNQSIRAVLGGIVFGPAPDHMVGLMLKADGGRGIKRVYVFDEQHRVIRADAHDEFEPVMIGRLVKTEAVTGPVRS